jgi:hypothetical protein
VTAAVIEALAGLAAGVILLLALVAVGARGGWPLHCAADAAAWRLRPPWDAPAGLVRGCNPPARGRDGEGAP